MDEELMEGIVEELKRADHLIFVSLKYTRTVDVLKHVIERFINALDIMFTAIAERLKEKGVIETVPTAPVQKCNLIKEKIQDEKIQEFLNYYMRLRKINVAKFTRSTEFRRHVHMTVILENDQVIIVNIDSVTEEYHNIKEFFEYLKEKYFVE